MGKSKKAGNGDVKVPLVGIEVVDGVGGGCVSVGEGMLVAAGGEDGVGVVVDRYLERAAELSGVDVGVLREMNASGELDRYLSERFYYLSLVAMGAVLEGIASGEVDTGDCARVALESAKVGQKLAGRDIQRKYIVNADVWEHAAMEAEVVDE